MSTDVIRDALAERLELQVKHGGASGVLHGAPLQLQVQLVVGPHHHERVYVLDANGLTPAAQQPPQLRVTATLPFRPALDARLAVAVKASYEALRSAGRVGFEQRLSLKGAELDRAEALVGPEAREALDAAFTGDPGLTVTDYAVTWSWQAPPPYPTVDQLEPPLRALARAHTAIVEASRTVRPPTGLEAAAVAFASMPLPPGMELRGSPVGLVGATESATVSVSAAPFAAGGWLARVRVSLPYVLPGSPRVLREDRFGWFERLVAAVSGRGEIIVGDRAFDQRFAIRSLKPEALVKVLSPAVRERMMALDKLVPVELAGNEITATGKCRDEATLVKISTEALALATAIGS